jgi:hypothetical protein
VNAVDKQAARLLWMLCGGPTGALRLEWVEDGRRCQHWMYDHPRLGAARAMAKFVHHLGWFGERYETRVGATAAKAPDSDPFWLPSWSLWAVVDTGDGVRRLARMRPRPTLVLQEGDTRVRTAFWALDRPLNWEWTARANRRLAHFLQGPKKFCDPDHAIRTPGSPIADGRVVPISVVVAEMNPTALYTAREVVQHLRDAPDPDAWRNRGAAA